MAIDANRQRGVGTVSPSPAAVQQRRSIVSWSPEPQEGGVGSKVFRYNPYHSTHPVEFGIETEPDQTQCPEGTRHISLWGRVSFVQHPSEPFVVRPEDVPDRSMATRRVFFGQLPYFVTDMELNWFTMTFGGGHVVVAPERILKKQVSGERLPTGCIHAYATPEAVEAMKRGMHKRILADDTGVWYARSESEMMVLADYVHDMKRDPQRRVHGMPYESVVVELATSRYMPPNPVLLRTPAPPPAMPPPYALTVAPPPPYTVVVGFPALAFPGANPAVL